MQSRWFSTSSATIATVSAATLPTYSGLRHSSPFLSRGVARLDNHPPSWTKCDGTVPSCLPRSTVIAHRTTPLAVGTRPGGCIAVVPFCREYGARQKVSTAYSANVKLWPVQSLDRSGRADSRVEQGRCHPRDVPDLPILIGHSAGFLALSARQRPLSSERVGRKHRFGWG